MGETGVEGGADPLGLDGLADADQGDFGGVAIGAKGGGLDAGPDVGQASGDRAVAGFTQRLRHRAQVLSAGGTSSPPAGTAWMLSAR